LVISQFSIGLCSLAVKSSHTARRKGIKKFGNKFVHLFFGLFSSLAGDDAPGAISQCLPPEWKVENDSDSNDPADHDSVGEPSALDKILSAIGKIINLACQGGGKLLKKIFNGKKLKFTKRKMFFEKSLKNKKMPKLFKKMKAGFQKFENKLVDAAMSLKQLQAIAGLGKKLQQIFATIHTVANTLLKTIMSKIGQITDCLKNLKSTGKDVAVRIYKIMREILNKVRTILSGGGAGLVKVFVQLLCHFDLFRKAIESLVMAIQQHDILDKHKHYGKFLGSLLKAFGSKKRRF